MNNEKIVLLCPKCKKLLAKMDRNGSCKNIYLFCKSCKQEYEITYKRANEPMNK